MNGIGARRPDEADGKLQQLRVIAAECFTRLPIAKDTGAPPGRILRLLARVVQRESGGSARDTFARRAAPADVVARFAILARPVVLGFRYVRNRAARLRTRDAKQQRNVRAVDAHSLSGHAEQRPMTTHLCRRV